MWRGTTAQNGYLQQLRGVAAVMVLLYHASLALEIIRGSSAFAHIFDVRFGLYGVCFFFSLSGYLMARSVCREDSFRFLAARVLRIYPMFFLAVGLMAILYTIFSVPFSLHPGGLLLMPYTPRRIEPLGVEWTLIFEMTFYVVLFAIAAVGLHSFIPLFAAIWAIAIAFVGVVWWPNQEWATAWPVYEMLVLLPSLSFAGGLLISHVGAAPPVGVAVLACVVAMAIDGYFEPASTSRYLASACAVVLVASLAARDNVVPRWSITRYLNVVGEKLGDWSYALYLCHVPLCILIYTRLPSFVPTPLAFGIALTVAIAVAALLGSIDVKIYKETKTALRATSAVPVRILSGLYFIVFICFSTITAYEFRSHEIAVADAAKFAATLLPIAHRDAELVGHLELLRFNKYGALDAAGWAFNPADPHREVFVAIAVGLSIVAVGQTSVPRPDVSEAYKLDHQAAPSGFELSAAACAADVVVFAFTMDGHTRVLPSSEGIKCPEIMPIKRVEG
jgi:exopolysaccharide production protein ExoZ